MNPAYRLLVLLACCTVVGACGDAAPDEPPGGRLPHVLAPVDTTNTVAVDDGMAAARSADPNADVTNDAYWQVEAPYRNWPRSDRVTYSRYRNATFAFTIAYPDTVLRPRSEVGAGHGREFASFDGKAEALVYAVENATEQTLAEQYQRVVDEAGLRIVYRLREDDWYVLSGYRGSRKFYDKSLLRDGVLKTFQVQYDTTNARYYDVIVAVMATSFEG